MFLVWISFSLAHHIFQLCDYYAIITNFRYYFLIYARSHSSPQGFDPAATNGDQLFFYSTKEGAFRSSFGGFGHGISYL